MWRQKSIVPGQDTFPVLHVHNPEQPLPTPPTYRNPSFYMFKPKPVVVTPPHSSGGDRRSVKSSRSRKTAKIEPEDHTPQFKKEFEKFHNENGVRTILGDIGPVQNGEQHRAYFVNAMNLSDERPVRMLLKNGYRHVYISRKFALRHGFIPPDAAPGHYGYGGLVKYVLRSVSWRPLLTTPSTV